MANVFRFVRPKKKEPGFLNTGDVLLAAIRIVSFASGVYAGWLVLMAKAFAFESRPSVMAYLDVFLTPLAAGVCTYVVIAYVLRRFLHKQIQGSH